MPGAPPAAAGTGLTPTQTLTTAPGLAGLPPGSVASPWAGGTPAGANCCGPVGANGPVTYEAYVRTGPNLIVGGSPEISGAARFGWQVNGGGRTLFMNPTRDAAFVVDLGIMYAYDGMTDSRVFDVFARTPATTTTGANGQQVTTPQPDQLQPFRIRSLTRTGLTYAFGRDWWLGGPATAATESGFNSRVGIDLGGRWNTIRADLLPVGAPGSYFRRSGVGHGIAVGAHYTAEVPMGAWILFGGARVEFAHTWSNVIPPQDGNVQDVSLLLSMGVRF